MLVCFRYESWISEFEVLNLESLLYVSVLMEHKTSVFPSQLEIREYCFLILRNSELRKIIFFDTEQILLSWLLAFGEIQFFDFTHFSLRRRRHQTEAADEKLNSLEQRKVSPMEWVGRVSSSESFNGCIMNLSKIHRTSGSLSQQRRMRQFNFHSFLVFSLVCFAILPETSQLVSHS